MLIVLLINGGTYKPAANNPGGLSNIDFPYTINDKTLNDKFAGAWSLKKILLPSGGQMEIQYEADDYAYVQNRRACDMFNVYGLGSSTDFTNSNALYSIYSSEDQNYVYVQLPTALQNSDVVKIKNEIFSKYLDGINQLAFKLNINMPKGQEPLVVYANFDDYGLCTNSTDNKMIYLHLVSTKERTHGPLVDAAIHYLIENLPAQAFPGYDLSDQVGIAAFLKMITSALSSLGNAFKNSESQMISAGKASSVFLASSFVRLNDPSYMKYGGGHRVKKIVLHDNWNAMSGQYNSDYGQEYSYTNSTIINGISVPISSGVASYEPGVGSEENPFREILKFEDKMPLASAIYGAIEMPILEALFPSPVVGYSKVTVRSIHRSATHGDSALRSAIGKQVTEFYTAKDFPTYYSYTPMSNTDYHLDPPFTFFYKETIDRRTSSQGFLVETNDMHGKMKSQAGYSENDETTPLTYTLHTYKNTGTNGLNDKVDFVKYDQSGAVVKGNMGIDMELMTDVREFSVLSNGFNGQIQTDFFSFVPPIFSIFMYALKSYNENKYRAVTTTKLINYHSIEDSVIVNDKGSIVSTKTIAYDAETGSPIVTATTNEFNDPVYNVNYPAYWAYSGTGPAYKNVGMEFQNVNFADGRVTSGVSNMNDFESGDELFITITGTAAAGCPPTSSTPKKLWVFDKSKNTTALTVQTKDLLFIDSAGQSFTRNGVSFRIMRSGKRNLIGLSLNAAVCMKNPVQNNVLNVINASNVVSAASTEYKEKWQTDADVILTKLYYTPSCSQAELDSVDCSGILEKKINPYLRGLIGNLKPYKSYTYYGSRAESDPTTNTDIRKNGYLLNFTNFWSFSGNSNLVPDYTNTNWVWNSELTKVNGKNQELETKDALNMYTSVQYGFGKNLPVAMIQNARYGEAFSESFEDYAYSESLNKNKPYPCKKYIDFYGTGIINSTETSGAPSAHTGKYALQVNTNSQVVKSLETRSTQLDLYNFSFLKDTSKVLSNVGGNFTFTSNTGSYYAPATANFGSTSFAIDVYPSATNAHYYNVVTDHYIQISTQAVYTFKSTLTTFYNNPSPQNYFNTIYVTITDINGNVINATTVSKPITQSTQTTSYTVSLCPGIYKITGNISELYNQSINYSNSHNIYSWSCTTSPSADYKTLSTINGCISTKPVRATDSMLNATFKLVPGKKMQFSAWVRETCDSSVCYKTTYSKNRIELQFVGGGATLQFLPSGPIIDGWQKIDSSFTVPTNATAASLVFFNLGTQPIYFDDVRIHPFNGNMKSYVYDQRTLRLSAELDENNYSTFYNYDEEGHLIRVKKETIQGIKTIQETRSANQKTVTIVQ